MLISKDFNLESFKRAADFDIKIAPRPIKQTIVLEGDLWQMGVQYGKQARKLIQRNAAVSAAELKMITGSWEKAFEKVCAYGDCISKKSPEITRMWKGIAQGADVPVEQIALLNCKIPCMMGPELCSAVCAWGSAVENGRLITAANVDNAMGINYFGTVLAVYPKRKNAYITSVALAGQINGGTVMNDKGLSVMMTAGQNAGSTVSRPGYDPVSVMGWLAMECDSLQAMKEMLFDMDVFGASNFLLASKEKEALVVEYTQERARTRTAGEFGEQDFIQIANHYMTDEMQKFHFPKGSGYDDSWVRYDMEQMQLRENAGNLTPAHMMDIMKSHRRLIDGNVIEEFFTTDPEKAVDCEFTPNMRGVDYQTVDTSMTIPEDGTYWIQFGCADKYVSFVPGALGQRVEYTLKQTPIALLGDLEEKAKTSIWKSGMCCNQQEGFLPGAFEKLTQAKICLWEGKTRTAKAMLEEQQEGRMRQIGAAATAFVQAQALAKEALVYAGF